MFEHEVSQALPVQAREAGCFRHEVLVMCTHPFAKEALTLHLVRSKGHERYFDCNLMHRKVLASSHQHLMAEAPVELPNGPQWLETGRCSPQYPITIFWRSPSQWK